MASRLPCRAVLEDLSSSSSSSSSVFLADGCCTIASEDIIIIWCSLDLREGRDDEANTFSPEGLVSTGAGTVTVT